ncbi:MAG: DUF2937 family protein, partial [Pseudomonadota bacterium]
TRYDRLQANLGTLQSAGPFERLRLVPSVADTEIAAKAWDDFKPAVPLSVEGAGFAGIGYATGWLCVAGIIGLARMAFRRKRRVA